MPRQAKESALRCARHLTPPNAADRVVREVLSQGGKSLDRSGKPFASFTGPDFYGAHHAQPTGHVGKITMAGSGVTRFRRRQCGRPSAARKGPSNGGLVGSRPPPATILTIDVPYRLNRKPMPISFHLDVRGRYNCSANDMAETIYDAGDDRTRCLLPAGVVRVRIFIATPISPDEAIRCAIETPIRPTAADTRQIGRGNRKRNFGKC